MIAFAEMFREKRQYVIAGQMLRAGCSVGANVKEAQGAESKADFIHKMKVALKEAEESEYRLQLCEFSKTLTNPGKLLDDVEAIIKVLNKIISTTKKKLK